ncbi:hypothetical protein ACV35T_30400, partial [Pseudomonas aeruginosa]
MQPIDRAQAQQRANDILVFQRELQRLDQEQALQLALERRQSLIRALYRETPAAVTPCRGLSLVGFREFPFFHSVSSAVGLQPPQPASRSIGILSRRGSAAFCDEG